MKRGVSLLLMMVMLTGCGVQQEMEQALALRSQLLSKDCSFCCRITADYIDYIEEFALDCTVDTEGTLHFQVVEPEAISGIGGSVQGSEGALEFEELILGFPLMADETLSPLAAPWLLVKTLRTGYLTGFCREGEMLRLTVNDSYEEDAFTMEIWLDGENRVTACEIGWRGRRVVSMAVEDFSCV